MEKFKFKLGSNVEEIVNNQSEIVFEIELVENRYRVKWTIDGMYHETSYSKEATKENVADGNWIVI